MVRFLFLRVVQWVRFQWFAVRVSSPCLRAILAVTLGRVGRFRYEKRWQGGGAGEDFATVKRPGFFTRNGSVAKAGQVLLSVVDRRVAFVACLGPVVEARGNFCVRCNYHVQGRRSICLSDEETADSREQLFGRPIFYLRGTTARRDGRWGAGIFRYVFFLGVLACFPDSCPGSSLLLHVPLCVRKPGWCRPRELAWR